MRLLITADLHYNHPRSRALAEDVIAQMNRAGGDVLLLVGDTATLEADYLERCLNLFDLPRAQKLFVAGNHELWTHGPDSYALYHEELPRRLHNLGWRFLEDDPFTSGSLAIVGSVGWYDHSFAQQSLGIPLRFYQNKISPGAATRFEEFDHLFHPSDDIAPAAMEIYARWNDGRFVKLHRSDEQFLTELLDRLDAQLKAVASSKQIVAAIHHVPFRELLPPPHTAQWDFAKAYLGSQRLGELLLRHPHITHAFCGHSHLPMESQIAHIHATNIGSGYRWKTFKALDLET